jgi:hypothetical protein
VDTKTGRKSHVPAQALSIDILRLGWSPSAHKFLIEIPATTFGAGLWRWHRDFAQSIESTSVVYFVDMDRQ